MLKQIEPSEAESDLPYYPCRATLTAGRIVDAVYVEPEKPYLNYWGVNAEDDKALRFINIDDIVKLESSLTRLPARFADLIYKSGESGMGYTIFTVVFADGTQQACVAGNAIDFIRYPSGKGPEDVAAVYPHEGRRDNSLVKGPEYYWCLYSEDGL